MTTRIEYERLIALVGGDQELVVLLIEEGMIEHHDDGFSLVDVDRAMASRTLLRELDVNLAGIEIILRLRDELALARRRLLELEGAVDPQAAGEGGHDKP